MKRILPTWCKEVKKSMIDDDINVTELAERVGFSRNYVSGVVNGRVYAPEIAKVIGEDKDLMYIELKTGYSDDGPAWIGYVKTSKTKKTIYFNDHAFQKYNGGYSNYVDIENGDEYWISGLKKRESNRHWDGHGKILIDRRAVNEYLTLIGEKELPLNLFEIIDIEDRFPVERVNNLLNDKE